MAGGLDTREPEARVMIFRGVDMISRKKRKEGRKNDEIPGWKLQKRESEIAKKHQTAKRERGE